MSENAMMITGQENSMQLVTTTLPAINGTASGSREHPPSNWRSSSTNQMCPIAFGIPPELLNPPMIVAAIHRPDGLQFIRGRINSAFYGQNGGKATQFKSQQEAAANELKHLETEKMRVAEQLKEVPPTRTLNGLVLPTGAALWGWWALVFGLIALNFLAIANAASYFRFQSQCIGIAILMAAPLLFVSIPVKYAASKLNEAARRRLGWGLACVGCAAFAVFVFTLAVRANPPSTADILDGTAQMATTGMVAWQLASQVILEIVIAAAFWHWIIELMSVNSKLVINPDAELLTTRLATLHKMMEPVRERLAEAEGNIQELCNCLDFWLQTAETLFLISFERERRIVEREDIVFKHWSNFSNR
jgi:hypothetical protein